MFDRIRDPQFRFVAACCLIVFCVVGWASTHVLIVITQPPESSWVFHLLLAISWIALLLTSLDIAATTEHRKADDEDSD